jgi:hypothetical protein
VSSALTNKELNLSTYGLNESYLSDFTAGMLMNLEYAETPIGFIALSVCI